MYLVEIKLALSGDLLHMTRLPAVPRIGENLWVRASVESGSPEFYRVIKVVHSAYPQDNDQSAIALYVEREDYWND